MGRGGRLDAHEQRLYLVSRLACEVADSRRDFQARAQDTRGESLALRRVVPSPKEKRRAQIRPLGVYVVLGECEISRRPLTGELETPSSPTGLLPHSE